MAEYRKLLSDEFERLLLAYDGFQQFTLSIDGRLVIDIQDGSGENHIIMQFDSEKDAKKWLSSHFNENYTLRYNETIH